MWQIIKYCKPFVVLITVIIILLIVQVYCDLALPGYMSEIVDQGVKLQNTTLIKELGIKMGILSGISLIVSVLSSYFSAKFADGFSRDIRFDVFNSVENFSERELDNFSTASLLTRTTNDVQQIQNVMEMLPKVLLYAPILAIGGIIKVFETKSQMSWIIGISVIIVSILIAILINIVIPNYTRVQQMTDKLNLQMRQMLTGLSVIRAFNTQNYEEKKFDNVNKELTSIRFYITCKMMLMRPIMTLTMNISTLMIVWFGAQKVMSSNLEVGTMIAMITYATQIIIAFLMFSMISLMLPRAFVSSKRVLQVINTKTSIHEPLEPKKFPEERAGIVEFRNVSFKYNDSDEYVLKDLSFKTAKGETTAIIGGTGTGKSTIVKLILRFYDVTNGEILVDGINIRDVLKKDLYNIIAYTPQKPALLSGTIRYNLTYGKKNATDNDIEKAVKTAQSYEFIYSSKDGLDTRVSQNATNFSGGQKQRLCIARALVKDAQIYMFDESFSALDYQTEFNLRKALKENYPHLTQIIVTQKVSSTMSADQIIVIDKERVVGVGTHRELMINCEVYKQIAKSQLSEEELKKEFNNG